MNQQSEKKDMESLQLTAWQNLASEMQDSSDLNQRVT